MNAEWINNTWHTQVMEYYLAMERNEGLAPATTWMNPENVMPDTKGHMLYDST